MDTLGLSVDIRDLKEKINLLKLRQEGLIPAVYYGHGQKTMSLKVNLSSFNKIYKKAGKTGIIDLKMGDDKSLKKALVHDIQVHPVTEKVLHVDFIHVSLTEKITAEVPIKFTGVAAAVKDLKGILSISKHVLEVKCLPQDLLKEIEVDISSLVDFRAVIHVKNVKVPAAWIVLDNADDVVITAVAPKEEKEEVAPVAAAVEGAAEGAVKEGEAKEGAETTKEAGKKEEGKK